MSSHTRIFGQMPAGMSIKSASITVFSEDGCAPRPFMSVPISDDLTNIIGKLIVAWSLFDGLLTESTAILLAYQNKSITGWRHLQTKKRMRLYLEELENVFRDFPEIINYSKKYIIDPAWPVKRVRDAIAHDHVYSAERRGRFTIRFVSLSEGKRQAIYDSDQLGDFLHKVGEIAGALDNFMRVQPFLPLSSASKSELQRVLGGDRWNAAISAMLRNPHEP